MMTQAMCSINTTVITITITSTHLTSVGCSIRIGSDMDCSLKFLERFACFNRFHQAFITQHTSKSIRVTRWRHFFHFRPCYLCFCRFWSERVCCSLCRFEGFLKSWTVHSWSRSRFLNFDCLDFKSQGFNLFNFRSVFLQDSRELIELFAVLETSLWRGVNGALFVETASKRSAIIYRKWSIFSIV